MLRSRLVRALDWMALAAIGAAVFLELTTGFSLRIAGLRLSARGGGRAAVIALALFALRLAIDRRTRLFDSPRKTLAFEDQGDAAARLASGRRRLYEAMLAVTGQAIFGMALLFAQISHMDRLPELGDPLFSIWRLAWVHHKLVGDPSPLFSPNIFHPQLHTLAYSDAMLLPALTMAPLLALGVHPVVAYNTILVLSFLASAAAMYVLVERLTGSAPAGFVAGLLFGFYPYRFEHYNHFELLMTYLMPLALLALHRFLETERVRYALAFAMLAAGQLYSSMYYGVFFAVCAASIFVALCALTPGRLGTRVRAAAAAAGLMLVLAWPLMRSYQAAGLGDRPAAEVGNYSAQLSDYAVPTAQSATWAARLPGTQRFNERALFPGATVILLAAIGLCPPSSRTRLAYVVGLLAAFAITTGYHNPVYRAIYDWFPFVRAIRSPARAGMLVGLTLAILAGFGLARLVRGRSRLITGSIVGVLVAAAAIDLRPVIHSMAVWRVPPPIYERLPRDRQVVLAELPMGKDDRATWSDTPHMYFSVWHWAKLVNGYSGHSPAGYGHFQDAMLEFPDERSIAMMRQRGVTHLTVNCTLFWNGCGAELAQIDGRPEFRLVSTAMWEDHQVRLYELLP